MTPRTLFSDPQFQKSIKHCAFLIAALGAFVVPYVQLFVQGLNHPTERLIALCALIPIVIFLSNVIDQIAWKFGFSFYQKKPKFDWFTPIWLCKFLFITVGTIGLFLLSLYATLGLQDFEKEHPTAFTASQWHYMHLGMTYAPLYIAIQALFLARIDYSILDYYDKRKVKKEAAKDAVELAGWNDSPALLEMSGL